MNLASWDRLKIDLTATDLLKYTHPNFHFL